MPTRSHLQFSLCRDQCNNEEPSSSSRGHSTSTRRSEGRTLGWRPQHCPGLLRQKHPCCTYKERNMNIQKYVQQDKTKEFQLWRHYWKNSYLTLTINSLCWRAGCHHATVLLQIVIQSGFHLYLSDQEDLAFDDVQRCMDSALFNSDVLVYYL